MVNDDRRYLHTCEKRTGTNGCNKSSSSSKNKKKKDHIEDSCSGCTTFEATMIDDGSKQGRLSISVTGNVDNNSNSDCQRANDVVLGLGKFVPLVFLTFRSAPYHKR